MSNIIVGKYKESSIRFTVSADEDGTIISIDNFPMHTVVYLDNSSARAFAERIINALDNQQREAA